MTDKVRFERVALSDMDAAYNLASYLLGDVPTRRTPFRMPTSAPIVPFVRSKATTSSRGC